MGYKTVGKEAQAQFIERKSRFIGFVRPVSTEEEAIDFIKEIKEQHREATHNVYAYALRENHAARFSDDGEPHGTAGKPVLGVIENGGLTDVALVVTRYFGGVLLGAGGLVRAYVRAAKEAVEAAGIADMQPHSKLKLTIEYGLYETLQRKLPTLLAVQEGADFASDVTLALCMPTESLEDFEKWLCEATGGKTSFEITGQLNKPLNCT